MTKLSFYDSGMVPIINLVFPDIKERCSRTSLLVRQSRMYELKQLDTQVNRDITKEQLLEKLEQLNLWNYKQWVDRQYT